MANKQEKSITPEPAALLRLFAGQIGAALDDAAAAMTQLTVSVLTVSKQVRSLQRQCNDSAAGTKGAGIGASLGSIDLAASDASTSLQFADFLQQRLTNVKVNLLTLADSVDRVDFNMSDERWLELLTATRDTLTMEAERQMFDAAFAPHKYCNGACSERGADSPVLFDSGDDV